MGTTYIAFYIGVGVLVLAAIITGTRKFNKYLNKRQDKKKNLLP